MAGDVQLADLSNLSYLQISGYNLSQDPAGTFQSQSMRKIQFVDQEATAVAGSLVRHIGEWPYNIQPNMESFIAKNSLALQLYIRDIRTMVCAIFVFLVLHKKNNKARILKLLNKKILGKLGKKQEEKKEEREPQRDLEKSIWGKDNDKGEFLVVTVTGSKRSTGARCNTIPKKRLKSFLNNEEITNKDIENKLGKKYTNKDLCKLLQERLKEQDKYTRSSM